MRTAVVGRQMRCCSRPCVAVESPAAVADRVVPGIVAPVAAAAVGSAAVVGV